MAALGVDLGGTRIKIGVVEGTAIVATVSLPNRSVVDDLSAVRAEAERLATRLGARIDAVGVAVPGVVNADGTGMARATNKYQYLETIDLRAWSREAFGVGAVVGNDARAALVGEVFAGCAQGHDDVVMITLGTGIGTAAMMGGRLVRGRSGHAGILGGHQTVSLDGPRCPCGNLGCGEALAGTWNVRDMVARAHRALGPDGAVPDVAQSEGPAGPAIAGFAEMFARVGTDAVARRVLEDACTVWGAVVAAMVTAYDPALVVLSGGVLRSADLIVPRIAAHLERHLWSSLPRPEIVVATDPDHSVVLGLAGLATTARRDHP